MTVHPVNMMVMMSVTTGTGPLMIGSVTGWRTAAEAAGAGEENLFWYTIRHIAAAEYEIGHGYVDVTTGQLIRHEVVESSSDNGPVDFSEGTKEVTSSAPAQYLQGMDIDRSVTIDMVFESDNVDKFNLLLELLGLMTDSIEGAHVWTIPPAYIDEDLVDFPMDIFLNSTDSPELFDSETSWRYWRILFGWEQCYTEVVSFGGGEAHLVVRVPLVTAIGGGTVVIIRSDTDQTSHIGPSGSLAAESVWDDNHRAVYHLSQDPSISGACILDSTANRVHGTPTGAMTSDNLIDMGLAKGLHFDGIDDAIVCGTFEKPEAFTIQAFVGIYTFELNALPAIVFTGTSRTGWGLSAEYSGDGLMYARVSDGSSKQDLHFDTLDTINYPPEGTMIHFTGDGTIVSLHKEDGTVMSVAQTVANEGSDVLALARWGSGTDVTAFAAINLASVRISRVARSAAWIKATNRSHRGTLAIHSIGDLSP